MSSFSSMKTKSKVLFKNLADKMGDEKRGGGFAEDTRFWIPDVDKAGNGFAIIRFLPATDGEDSPFVKLYSHGFKVGTRWYIENCGTTIGEKCPACEENSKLWNTGIPSNQDIVRQRKRRIHYISNILVVSDNKNPDNEGKQFLFKYGFKIFEKIMASIQPEFEDETPLNPFDFWEGANFKIKIRNVEGYRSYDRSEFESPSALFDGDDQKLEQLWKQQYKLKELIAPSEFKPYATLKEKCDLVLGNVDALDNAIKQDADIEFETVQPKAAPKVTQKPTVVDTGEDSDLAMYASLLADD